MRCMLQVHYLVAAVTSVCVLVIKGTYNVHVCMHSTSRLLGQLGSGQFGQVCKGAWSIAGASMELAIKTLKSGAPEGEKVKILQEAAIMGQFSHPNVVKLYGVVTVGEPVSLTKHA